MQFPLRLLCVDFLEHGIEVTGNMYRPPRCSGGIGTPQSYVAQARPGKSIKAWERGERGLTPYSNTLLEPEGHIADYLVSGRLDKGALPGSLSFELLNAYSWATETLASFAGASFNDGGR